MDEVLGVVWYINSVLDPLLEKDLMVTWSRAFSVVVSLLLNSFSTEVCQATVLLSFRHAMFCSLILFEAFRNRS